MANALQRRYVSDWPHGLFSPQAVKHAGSTRSATARRTMILLVGRNGAWPSTVPKPLEKFDCEFTLVSPEAATPDFVRTSEPAVILLDSSVSRVQRKLLVAELTGSPTTIFYTFPVENGCWWLAALIHGESRHAAPAFRRKEFPRELERILAANQESSSLVSH